jgi:hypothetical protein
MMELFGWGGIRTLLIICVVIIGIMYYFAKRLED